MNPITLLPTPAHLEANPSRGDYIYGESQGEFLRTDWTLEQVLATTGARDFVQGLPLGAISKCSDYGWGALRLLLPEDSVNVAAMKGGCVYDDVVTGHRAMGLVPLYLLTTNVDAYAHDKGFSMNRLRSVADRQDDVEDYFDGHKKHRAYLEELALSRIEQVLLGSGYTDFTLPSDGSVGVSWQFVALSNGDVLLLAGLEWFNK